VLTLSAARAPIPEKLPFKKEAAYELVIKYYIGIEHTVVILL
jgi:hypothetical protein